MEHRSQPYIELVNYSSRDLGSHGFLLFDITTRLALRSRCFDIIDYIQGVLWEALRISNHERMHRIISHSPCLADVWLTRPYSLELQGKGCIDDSSIGERKIAMVYERIIQESKNSRR